MDLSGYQRFEQRDFGGAWLLPDPPDVPITGGLFAKNCEFTNGQVSKRTGFVKLYKNTSAGVSDVVSGMFKWVSELGNILLLYAQSTGVQVLDTSAAVLSPSVVDTSTLGANTADFVQAGSRAIYAVWVQGSGVNSTVFTGNHPKIITRLVSTSWVADNICAPPLAYVPAAPTEPGVGVITAGLHNIGYRVLDRSGYLARPSPDSGGNPPSPQTFTPVAFTSAGSKNLSIVLNPGGGGWPVNGFSVQIIMSPVSDPNRYFLVPGTITLLPIGGGVSSKTIVWSIDDATLMQTRGAECTDSLNLYSLSTSGGNPLYCYHVASIGNRTFYIVNVLDSQGNLFSQIFVSDIGDNQTFSFDEHFITLPGQRQISTVFDMAGTTYILGPHWTYRTTDNLDLPSTWAGPFLVDGEKGTINPRGVTVSPSGQYAWVADTSGLYYFNGTYGTPGSAAALPVSYLQAPDWNLIRWDDTSATLFNIKDDPVNHRVYVLAGLANGSFTDIVIMVWDYTNGFNYDQVKYSKWVVGANPTLFSMELMENTLNANTHKRGTELWIPITHTTGYALLRKTGTFDSPVFHDENENGTGAAIDFQYDTPIHPQASASAIFQGAGAGGGGTSGSWFTFIASHIRAKAATGGTGTMQTTVYNYDKTKNAVLANTALVASPGAPILRRIPSGCSNAAGLIYHFRENTVDGSCILSGLTSYYSDWVTHV